MVSKYATVNPATGEFVQGFETISDADADRALDRAHEAYLDWREADLKERAAVIGRWSSISASNTPPTTATAATSASAKRRASPTRS